MTKKTKPRQAMSARQVDRIERDLRMSIRLTRARCVAMVGDLQRLLRMVRGSERR